MLIDPETLTIGERLELSRRRAGMSQRETAALMGLPFRRYVRAEHDEYDHIPTPDIDKLSAGEECRLMRTRAGMTLQRAEEMSGFKAKWIHRVERGDTRSAAPLEAFWTCYMRERAG